MIINDNKYIIIKNMKRVYYSRNNNKVFIYNKKYIVLMIKV